MTNRFDGNGNGNSSPQIDFPGYSSMSATQEQEKPIPRSDSHKRRLLREIYFAIITISAMFAIGVACYFLKSNPWILATTNTTILAIVYAYFSFYKKLIRPKK